MEAENGSAGTAAAQPVKVESQEGQPEGKVTSEDPAAAAEALLEQILADLREMSVMLEAPTPEMSQEIFDTQCVGSRGDGAQYARHQPALRPCCAGTASSSTTSISTSSRPSATMF